MNVAVEQLKKMEDNGCSPDGCTYDNVKKAFEFALIKNRKGLAIDAHSTSLFHALLAADKA